MLLERYEINAILLTIAFLVAGTLVWGWIFVGFRRAQRLETDSGKEEKKGDDKK